MDYQEALDLAYDCPGWFDIRELAFALLENDLDKLAKYRVCCQRLKAAKEKSQALLDAAPSDSEKKKVLAAVSIDSSMKEVSSQEIELEKAKMTRQASRV